MRTYKYPIRTHPKTKRLGNMLDDLADLKRHILTLEQRYYRRYGKYLGRYRLQPHLTKLLQRTKKHWAWIPRDTLDAVIIRIDTGYQRLFAYINAGRTGRKVGRPKQTAKHKMRSAKFQTGYKLEEGRVCLSFKVWDEKTGKLKFHRVWYGFHQHRDWNGDVRYIQILRDNTGEYWLYIITDDTSTEPMLATGKSVGADFGMKDAYLTLSTGEKIQSPEFLKQSLKQLRHLNKGFLSRKVKGSNNWWRAVREIARLYRKMSRQRLDWHWKLATDLCQRFDTLAFETLNLTGMKRLWGRKVSDLALGQFIQLLKYKCIKHSREFRQVGQWTATTKPCSDCGFRNENISLSDRQWRCPECGSHHDRDINAAINILRLA